MGYQTKYDTNLGVLIEEVDEYAPNPREADDGTFSKFYTFGRRINSPDKHNYGCFLEWMSSIISSKKAAELDNLYQEKKTSEANKKLVEYAKERGIILLPVYRFEHSDVAYKTGIENPFGDPWDSGMTGVIYCEKKDIYRIYQKRICKSIISLINKMMEAEVELYSYYANGEAYVYHVEGTDDYYGTFYGDIDENGVKSVMGITECKML